MEEIVCGFVVAHCDEGVDGDRVRALSWVHARVEEGPIDVLAEAAADAGFGAEAGEALVADTSGNAEEAAEVVFRPEFVGGGGHD
jgi:hypothetical protein